MRREGKTYGWGLIGPGRFAREFASELMKEPRAGLVAVASRNLEKASAFAGEFGFQQAYGDYDELIADPRVEIVYIVVPHVFHAGIASRAVRAGKAVLCEKPLTPGAEDSRALIELAVKENVFLMEAMKTGFLPAIREAKRWIEEGRIGEPRLARADFCFQGPSDPEDRLMNPALGGGAVLDVGIYPLHLTRHLLGEVDEIFATGSLTATGVEGSVAMISRHVSGASSAMTCSFETPEAMSATIFGTEGRIEIPTFHAAIKATLIQGEETVEVYRNDSGGMVGAEIRAVMEALDEGLIESPLHRHEDTLKLAELMDEVRSQVGVTLLSH